MKEITKMDEMGKMSILLKWFWLFQIDEMDKMSICL